MNAMAGDRRTTSTLGSVGSRVMRSRGASGASLATRSAVECWIGVVQEADRRVVHLAGRLGEAQVPDLLRACAGAAVPVQLNLTELLSADAVGIEALYRVRLDGAVLVCVPEYIQLKLDSLARAASLGPRGVRRLRKPRA